MSGGPRSIGFDPAAQGRGPSSTGSGGFGSPATGAGTQAGISKLKSIGSDLKKDIGTLSRGGRSEFLQKSFEAGAQTYIGSGGSQPFNLDDVKALLEEKSDRHKLDGMKRCIAMVSKGQDAAPLFPYVVKNVVTKNIELKKLVTIFLTHYAELEPDNTLLAINTIQKDLNQPNQFVRASALRVLSNIRLKIIIQIVLHAIEKCVKDISPFVRKTAAHAISKVYNLEPELKDELVPSLVVLLGDQSTMVLGSAVACWQEVCPDEFELIHPHFRKLVHVLADIDEWGQLVVLGMFLRYGRTNFADPNLVPADDAGEQAADANDKGDEPDLEGWDQVGRIPGVSGTLDPDHRKLLDNAVQLLRSRNPAVVLSVSTLFFYLAPEPEAQRCAKALTRIMRKDRETQFVVLANIGTMATQRPSMFEPVVTEFFVKPYDPAYARALNLEILTHVVSADSISKVLRELMSYIHRFGDDLKFVTDSIRAIGRCAAQVPSVADRCLHGLMSLLGSKNPAVVAESIIIIKRLLQQLVAKQETGHSAEDTLATSEVDLKGSITHVSRLLQTVDDPQARASIVWLIGEYSHFVPLIAPDVLRQLAKSFPDEKSPVKLQVLNLGAKLMLATQGNDAEIIRKLFAYVLSSAKYDMSYDVRDRSRLMRKALFADLKIMKASANRLFKPTKPLPAEAAPSDSRLRFTLNSLSHLLSTTCEGYQTLPDFPEEPLDPTVRDTYVETAAAEYKEENWDEEEEFYWEDEQGYEEAGAEEGFDESAFYGDEAAWGGEEATAVEEPAADDFESFFEDAGNANQEEQPEEEVAEEDFEAGGDDIDSFFDDAF